MRRRPGEHGRLLTPAAGTDSANSGGQDQISGEGPCHSRARTRGDSGGRVTRAVLRRTARVEYESKLSAIAQLPGPVRRSEEPRALLSAGFARRCTPSV